MTDAVANLGNGLQQSFPFMKLPAELRLVVYELAMRSHLEDIDRTKFFQGGPPGIEVSLEAANKMREARKLEVAEFERRTESQAAPYLGALALLHTSKMVYWESYHAMRDLVEPHRSARWDISWEAFWRMLRASFGGNKHTADLLKYEHDEMSAIWSYLGMVNRSFSKTVDRWSSNYYSVCFHGNLYGGAKRPAKSTTKAGGSTRSAAVICRDGALADAVKYFPGICDKIQKRLEGGAGVRTAFKAEVQERVRWKITDEDVAIMIDGITALGHALETIRGPDPSNKLRSFRVIKHKSRPKRRLSRISCDSPKTWLSTDEMDTGP